MIDPISGLIAGAVIGGIAGGMKKKSAEKKNLGRAIANIGGANLAPVDVNNPWASAITGGISGLLLSGLTGGAAPTSEIGSSLALPEATVSFPSSGTLGGQVTPSIGSDLAIDKSLSLTPATDMIAQNAATVGSASKNPWQYATGLGVMGPADAINRKPAGMLEDMSDAIAGAYSSPSVKSLSPMGGTDAIGEINKALGSSVEPITSTAGDFLKENKYLLPALALSKGLGRGETPQVINQSPRERPSLISQDQSIAALLAALQNRRK